ncbi:EAL domain-containing protein [Acinetobacter chinensis]|uniref:EAL domain-containing protein n=1 Tax=Acinetobacter chinensis TaxID=2004650 RepID=A0A3B7LZI1_9GAMM|nr:MULTISPECIES: EAL domain-containing protein [Acinetobacter]AXY55723.1 EAL domain-containing protein [Acinetobacter chinensis]AXY61176.1 EAL domain-containing protein [Acinetobacter sp. WCHAc010052]MDV2469764.1 EAL domain-containing protein [Acinetobacter chinensis]WOE42049.1 EAL domain-containing protein [Acinetobacter chinensis]
MVHVHYDIGLVLGSVAVAILTCYLAVSVEQLLFWGNRKKYEKLILIGCGALLGAAIWSMHFVGMLACHLPSTYHLDYPLTFVSYVIAFIASTFAVWLTARPTLPLPRLILGAVLMGLGISGMHYTGMMGLILDDYKIYHDPLIVVFSILIAISGSGLTFWLTFKYKNSVKRLKTLKFMIASMMALSIVGMHYTGMSAVMFYPDNGLMVEPFKAGQGIILFTIIFITSLVLVAAFSVAVLEQRLEERNKQLSKANRELANQAIQDSLTRLPNRMYLSEYSHFLFVDHRQKNTKVAFLYIDLDRFKAVNDVFGHHIGDQLLIQLATRIHRGLNDKEKLLRIGGDEFLLVVEDATVDYAMQLAEKTLDLIQESFQVAGKDINVSASIGISMYPDHGNNLQDLLINADAAMLTSKYQGRNTFSVFSYSYDQQEARSQTRLINDLYKAVDEQQFVMFYQPKFKTGTYDICGVESLIRWKHPGLGLLTPGMFIKGAEKTGLIIPMGYWALEQACKQIQQWEKSGSDFFPVAVNLSAVQFEHKHLFSTLEMLFERYEINPGHLMIEITESTAMHHIDSSIRSFEHLRKMGIKLAIDDFGTGHSSFLYLKNLPVDELKIDRGFIQDLATGSKDELILESIIQLAIKLGLTVTAEGVESPLQAEILTRLGCQQLQGYLLGIPVEVERLEAMEFRTLTT